MSFSAQCAELFLIIHSATSLWNIGNDPVHKISITTATFEAVGRSLFISPVRFSVSLDRSSTGTAYYERVSSQNLEEKVFEKALEVCIRYDEQDAIRMRSGKQRELVLL